MSTRNKGAILIGRNVVTSQREDGKIEYKFIEKDDKSTKPERESNDEIFGNDKLTTFKKKIKENKVVKKDFVMKQEDFPMIKQEKPAEKTNKKLRKKVRKPLDPKEIPTKNRFDALQEEKNKSDSENESENITFNKTNDIDEIVIDSEVSVTIPSPTEGKESDDITTMEAFFNNLKNLNKPTSCQSEEESPKDEFKKEALPTEEPSSINSRNVHKLSLDVNAKKDIQGVPHIEPQKIQHEKNSPDNKSLSTIRPEAQTFVSQRVPNPPVEDSDVKTEASSIQSSPAAMTMSSGTSFERRNTFDNKQSQFPIGYEKKNSQIDQKTDVAEWVQSVPDNSQQTPPPISWSELVQQQSVINDRISRDEFNTFEEATPDSMRESLPPGVQSVFQQITKETYQIDYTLVYDESLWGVARARYPLDKNFLDKPTAYLTKKECELIFGYELGFQNLYTRSPGNNTALERHQNIYHIIGNAVQKSPCPFIDSKFAFQEMLYRTDDHSIYKYTMTPFKLPAPPDPNTIFDEVEIMDKDQETKLLRRPLSLHSAHTIGYIYILGAFVIDSYFPGIIDYEMLMIQYDLVCFTNRITPCKAWDMITICIFRNHFCKEKRMTNTCGFCNFWNAMVFFAYNQICRIQDYAVDVDSSFAVFGINKHLWIRLIKAKIFPKILIERGFYTIVGLISININIFDMGEDDFHYWSCAINSMPSDIEFNYLRVTSYFEYGISSKVKKLHMSHTCRNKTKKENDRCRSCALLWSFARKNISQEYIAEHGKEETRSTIDSVD